MGANVACLVVAYVSVGLRFMSRLKIGTHLGLDDWLICGAAVSCVSFVGRRVGVRRAIAESICWYRGLSGRRWDDSPLGTIELPPRLSLVKAGRS